MLCCYYSGHGVGATLPQKEWRLILTIDWLMPQLTLCCYYGCRDLESVLRCTKKNGASLCVNWLIDCAGYFMLLLQVLWFGVGASLHQEEQRLTVLTDWLMAQVKLCCYYGCQDLKSVLRCIKKNGASLCFYWLIDGASYACYYWCRDLESVLCCIKKSSASLCLTNRLIDGAGYTMLLLRVRGSGVVLYFIKKNDA